jgi:hypothetical protein
MGSAAVPNPPAKSEQDDRLTADGLKLLRLFLSIESKVERDRVFQLVEKFIEKLKEQE